MKLMWWKQTDWRQVWLKINMKTIWWKQYDETKVMKIVCYIIHWLRMWIIWSDENNIMIEIFDNEGKILHGYWYYIQINMI